MSRKTDHTKADADAARRFDTLKDCSCMSFGCGNPRRADGHQGPAFTRQERLADLYLQEEIEHLRLENPEDAE